MSSQSTTDGPASTPRASREGRATGPVSGADAASCALELIQQECLLLIDEFHGRIGGARLVDIAAELGVPSASTSRVVRHLNKEGFVCRRSSWRLLLTDAGEEVVRALRARCKPVAGLLLAMGLPEQAAKREAVKLQKGMSPEALAAIRHHLPRVKTACRDV